MDFTCLDSSTGQRKQRDHSIICHLVFVWDYSSPYIRCAASFHILCKEKRRIAARSIGNDDGRHYSIGSCLVFLHGYHWCACYFWRVSCWFDYSSRSWVCGQSH